MKTSIQHFSISILFTIILPLLPLFLEARYNNGFIRESMLTLAVAMYSTAKGISSKEPIIWGISLFITIYLIAMYGTIPKTSYLCLQFSLNIKFQTIILLGIIISHTTERWVKHCIKKEPFISFNNNEI